MKAFFTQPIGNLARQNAIGFIVCNIYLIATGFELFESIDGVNRIFNFAWGFTLLAIIISEASIEATLAPVSIFAITLLIFKSGRATCSFQPTALFSFFFFAIFYKIT